MLQLKKLNVSRVWNMKLHLKSTYHRANISSKGNITAILQHHTNSFSSTTWFPFYSQVVVLYHVECVQYYEESESVQYIARDVLMI